MTTPQQTVRVDLGAGAYDVIVGAGVLTQLGVRAARRMGGDGRALLVADDGLPSETIDRAFGALRDAGVETTVAMFRAGEQNKSLEAVRGLLETAAGAGLERRDLVVGLGGGVVTDVAGFVGAIYKRGVPVVQCPTTLLAMVDASVGGKTGVNLRTRDGLLKNLVGAFWQPEQVLADVRTLGSLPDRQRRAGLAECVKHALVAGDEEPDLLDRAAGATTDDDLIDLIARNVRIKARVVEADERERATPDAGGRAVLNLGHTFAHAIETVEGLSPTDDADDAPLLHGEAVAIGLVAASAMAKELGLADDALVERVRAAVADAGLPTSLAGLPDDGELLASMRRDKKVSRGRLRIVVPLGEGGCRVVEDPPEAAVRAGWAAVRAG